MRRHGFVKITSVIRHIPGAGGYSALARGPVGEGEDEEGEGGEESGTGTESPGLQAGRLLMILSVFVKTTLYSVVQVCG